MQILHKRTVLKYYLDGLCTAQSLCLYVWLGTITFIMYIRMCKITFTNIMSAVRQNIFNRNRKKSLTNDLNKIMPVASLSMIQDWWKNKQVIRTQHCVNSKLTLHSFAWSRSPSITDPYASRSDIKASCFFSRAYQVKWILITNFYLLHQQKWHGIQ